MMSLSFHAAETIIMTHIVDEVENRKVECRTCLASAPQCQSVKRNGHCRKDALESDAYFGLLPTCLSLLNSQGMAAARSFVDPR